MKSANSLVKYTKKGDYIYCFKRQCVLPVCIFSPVMFFLTNYLVEGFSKSSEWIFLLSLLFCALGIAAALTATDVFISKKKSCLWFSFGISKCSILKNRIICGTLYLLIAIYISFAVPLFFKLDISQHDDLLKYLIAVIGTTVLALLSFSLTVFFCIKTGTAREGAFLAVLTQCLPLIFVWFSYRLFDCFINGSFQTIAHFEQPEYIDVFTFISFLSPYNLTIFYESAYDLSEDMSFFFLLVIFSLAIILISIILSFLTLKKHRSENIDKPLTSALTSSIVSIAVYLAVSTAVTVRFNYSLTYILLLSVPVMAYFVIRLLLNRKNKQSLYIALKQTVPAVLFSVFIVLFCKTYAFGYLTSVPDINEIEYASIVPSSDFRSNDFYFRAPIRSQNQSYGHFNSEKDLRFITELHRETVKNLGEGNNMISFHYKLKNGKIINREYYFVSDKAALKSLGFTESDWFEGHLNACLGLKNSNADYIEDSYYYPEMLDTYLLLNNTLSESINLTDSLSTVDIYSLKKAVVEDLINLSLQEIFKPGKQPLYYLHFYESDFLDTSPIPIYSSMKNTVDFITERNLSVKNTTADGIESVQYIKLNGDMNFYCSDKYGFYYAIDKTIASAFSDGYASFTDTKNVIYVDEWSEFDDLTENGTLPLAPPATSKDKGTIKEFFNAHRAHYCTIGDKGTLVNFRLKSGGSFIAYVPESAL